MAHANRVRERVETAKRARSANPNRRSARPQSAAAPANITVSSWGQEREEGGTILNRGGTRGGALKLPGTTTEANEFDNVSRIQRTPDEEAFHVSMMGSYGTGEIEVLWQNLTSIPKSIMMSTLSLQCQHLTALRISGNKLTIIPLWLFPNLHSLRELNVR